MSESFELRRPDEARACPVLVEIPHASTHVPESLRDELDVPPDALWRDADLHVDALLADAPAVGASLLCARHSRYVVDLNRAPDDLGTVGGPSSMPRSGARGVVWSTTSDGRPVLRRPLDEGLVRARVERFHAPYHRVLREEIERLRDRWGWCVLLAAHSMPSVGRAGHADAGVARADVVPGSRGRTSADARVIDLVDAHFRAAGLVVRHDEPYRGGYTTAHYGRPERHVHAIQIELNRALYMDERTGERRVVQFEWLAALLCGLVAALGQLRLR
ncbi:MAG: N-formylglutamate amidohydrolase [Myxococcota bacterium]|nr:N-formylglutamate amidohydrolase [Myxococcota bacterium]MDW8363092.1 N-formylglutamate amidohydrolase [Myxococcales bacterium]